MNISCKISSSDTTVPLGLEVWIDDLLIYNIEHLDESVDINHEISDDDADHELKFLLKNKTSEHTKVDEAGNITQDAVLTISDLQFDDIALQQLFYDHAIYVHDFNGSQPEIQDKFYGHFGCNGTVSLKFSTPVYLWLLDNL